MRTTITNKLFDRYSKHPKHFRNDLFVDIDGEPTKFIEAQDPWQREDFLAIDPGLMLCNGRANKGEHTSALSRAYLERSRGHSKTTDIAMVVAWALAFATRPIKGYAFAADKDQAALLKDALETLVRLNPWLGHILEVQKGQVVNIAQGHPGKGAKLEISSSDVGSSYGILPDLIVADEVSHWQGDGSLWHSLISSAAKRSNCLLLTISNAGFIDSWVWQVRETARQDKSWFFSRLDGPQASWITPQRLEEQRRMLPNVAYKRLWLNEWSSGGGDALTPEDIDAAFVNDIEPMLGKEKGFHFIGGLDLGLTRDCAAFVVLAIPKGGKAGKIRLAHNKLWRPTLGSKINLLDVERHVLDVDQQFGLEFVAFDPWQAEHLAQTIEADSGRSRRNQRLFRQEPFMREVAPVAANLRQQATLTIEFFQDRRFVFYDCEPLRRDLHKLRVEEKSYGCRLVSPRDGEGHGDTFSAFALALVVGNVLSTKKPVNVTPLFNSNNTSEVLKSALAQFDYRKALYNEAENFMREPDPSNGMADAKNINTIITPIYPF